MNPAVLPSAPPQYDAANEAAFRLSVQQALQGAPPLDVTGSRGSGAALESLLAALAALGIIIDSTTP